MVVIGSGATAVTLVPEMAKKAAARHHAAAFADLRGGAAGGGCARQQIAAQPVGKARLPPDPLAQRAVRDVFLPTVPAQAGAREAIDPRRRQRALGPDYDIGTHFTPRYNPWEQRLCLVPDGDLFRAIREKRASVVTSQIDTFTRTAFA